MKECIIVQALKWLLNMLRVSKLKYLIILAFVSVNVHFLINSILRDLALPSSERKLPMQTSANQTVQKYIDEYALFNPIPSNETNITDFDSYCEIHGEWEHLRNVGYFKRLGAYFFSDASLIHVLFVSKYPLLTENLEIELKLRIYHSQKPKSRMLVKIAQDRISLSLLKFTEDHAFMALDAKINLIETLKNAGIEYDPGKFGIDVLIGELNSKSSTKHSLNLKIKEVFTDYSSKRGVSVCGQCVYIEDRLAQNQFKWWVLQNKRVGMEKIFVCNVSIPNDVSMRRFLRRHADLLVVSKLKCLPNFFASNSSDQRVYAKKYTGMAGKTKPGLKSQIEVFDLVYENECYLDQMNKYKYISILDIDELVVPYLASTFANLSSQVEYIAGLKQVDDLNREREKFTEKYLHYMFYEQMRCDRYKQNETISIVESYIKSLTNTIKVS
jgi:hypothetical protein